MQGRRKKKKKVMGGVCKVEKDGSDKEKLTTASGICTKSEKLSERKR